MFVKPVDDRQVPDPEAGGFLPSSGRQVADTQYWYRRIADGDVVQVRELVVEVGHHVVTQDER